MLVEVASDAQHALRAVEVDEQLRAEETIAEAVRLLREMVGQEFDTTGDDAPRPRHGRHATDHLGA